MFPSMGQLDHQCLTIGFVKLFDLVNFVRVLCDQGAFSQKVLDAGQPILCGEPVDIFKKLRLGNANKRILDSENVSLE